MHDQPTVKVRPAEAPRTGEWVVEWRSPLIAGPSYLYFPTEAKAHEAVTRILEDDRGPMQSLEETPTAEPPTQPSVMEEILHWGRRLLQELPADVSEEAARRFKGALERLEEEGGI